jgi:hypothetical protein
MATLDELMAKFASADDADSDTQIKNRAVASDTHHKLASEGDTNMHSLQDIYLAIAGQDHEKTAAAAAYQGTYATEEDDIDVDFAKMAEQIAEQEASEEVEGDDDGNSIMKVAAEYDSAGRIMARGFFDEFQKLAAGIDNQMTESPSAASTPSLGDRGLPTMETNFAGSENHDKALETAGQAAKQNYLDSLAPTKSINAGQGTGDDPEAAAISLGGGSPAAFATVRDLTA